MAVVSFDGYADTDETYAISATVTGLEDSVVAELELNGGSTVPNVAAGQTVSFPARLRRGASYTIRARAPGHHCTDVQGAVGGDDVSVRVPCRSDDTALADLAVGRGAIVKHPSLLDGGFHADFALLPIEPVSVTALPRGPGATILYDGRDAGASVVRPLRGSPLTLDVGVVSASAFGSQSYQLLVDTTAPTYVKASNSATGARFGSAIAVSGDTIAVGAPEAGSKTSCGSVYVFTRTADGTGWREEAIVEPSPLSQGLYFGTSVALSGDTLAVGAPGDSNGGSSAGAAYIFTRTAGVWTQRAYLKAAQPRQGDLFGGSIALSGQTVAVGAIGEAGSAKGVNGPVDASLGGAGAVYVFTASGDAWSQQAYVKASNPQTSTNFGNAVALDGDTLVVGAIQERGASTGINGDQTDSLQRSGAVYVFTRTGSTWSQQAYVKASNTRTGAAFGTSVALANDTLVVGDRLETGKGAGVDGDQSDGGFHTGAVYVFGRSGSTWSQRTYVKAPNPRNEAEFGRAVAIAGDVVVIGAQGEDGSARGASDAPDPALTGVFGAGAAYVLRRSAGTWTHQAYLKAPNSGPSFAFGGAVGVSDGFLVVGAATENGVASGVNGTPGSGTAINSGAAYVY